MSHFALPSPAELPFAPSAAELLEPGLNIFMRLQKEIIEVGQTWQNCLHCLMLKQRGCQHCFPHCQIHCHLQFQNPSLKNGQSELEQQRGDEPLPSFEPLSEKMLTEPCLGQGALQTPVAEAKRATEMNCENFMMNEEYKRACYPRRRRRLIKSVIERKESSSCRYLRHESHQNVSLATRRSFADARLRKKRAQSKQETPESFKTRLVKKKMTQNFDEWSIILIALVTNKTCFAF